VHWLKRISYQWYGCCCERKSGNLRSMEGFEGDCNDGEEIVEGIDDGIAL
jgi:hypothetical protein